jgi:hypothetical protein
MDLSKYFSFFIFMKKYVYLNYLFKYLCVLKYLFTLYWIFIIKVSFKIIID